MVNEKTERTDGPYIALENIVSWDARFIPTGVETEGTSACFSSGDVLFGKLRPYLAKGFLPDYDGICSTEFLVLRPMKGIVGRYLLYWMLSSDFIGEIRNQVAGVKMPRTDWASVGAMEHPFPTVGTQQRIVNYLDEKTAAIDGKVAVLEKKLAAYKRLKKSIINRAVTRGLDPNVKLKDSGVDWIGQVPERWKIFRLKDLISSVDSGGTPKATNEKFYSDSSDGVPWVTIADMSSFDYVIETQKHLTDAGVQDKNLEVYPIGTVLYSMYATIGKVSELAIPATINQAMLAIQNNWRSHKSYFKYSLRAFELWVSAYTTESTQKNLNADRVRRFLMPTPPLAEQQAIADYLDVECAKIDKAEEIVEKQIDAYKRLKRSLINEVVTGKRKVA